MSDSRSEVRTDPELMNPPRILLLVDQESNRGLLVDNLEDAHTVLTDPAHLEDDSEQVDLVILDAPSFSKHAKTFRERRHDAEPTLLPGLFLSHLENTDRLPDEVWETVDDVVTLPIGTRVLDTRVENLLRQRSLSLDLTKRKEQSERRFETLFDATPDPVAVVRPDGQITNVNTAFEQAYGVEAAALEGRRITDISFSPSDPVERLLLRVLDHDVDRDDATVEWSTTDGQSIFAELNANVVTGLDGASERIGIFRDVTDRTMYERELERQNERLEDFAGTITHDLRNPLSIARGHLQLAREQSSEERFDTIEKAHRRMENLIEEVLSLAQQGTTVLEPESVDLRATAESAWSHVETDNATLEVQGDMQISADPGRLESLFENLFRNAIEHAGPGVTVTIESHADGFTVYDDGPGIDPADRDEIFQPGVSSDPDGTGFGLPIVDQIVDAHGWTITVSNGPDGGACFEITDVEIET